MGGRDEAGGGRARSGGNIGKEQSFCGDVDVEGNEGEPDVE